MINNLELPLCLVLPEAVKDFADVSDDNESQLKAARWCGKCSIRLACYSDKVAGTSDENFTGSLWAGVYFAEDREQEQVLDIKEFATDAEEQIDLLVASLRDALVNTKTQYYGRHDRLTLDVLKRLETVYERDWKYPEVQELCRRMIIAFLRHSQVLAKDSIVDRLEVVYAALNSYFETEVGAMYEHIPYPQQNFLVRYLTFRSAGDYPNIRDELKKLGLPGGYGSWQIVHNPRDPIAAGKQFSETVKELTIANPEIPLQVLADIARNYPTSSEQELENLRIKAREVMSSHEYSAIPEEVALIVIMGRRDANKALADFKSRLNRVQDYVQSYDYLNDNLTPIEVMRITARIWRPWNTLWSIARLNRSGINRFYLDEQGDGLSPYDKIADTSPEGRSPEDIFIGDESRETLRTHIENLLSGLNEQQKNAILMWYGIDDRDINASHSLEIDEKVAQLLGCDVESIDSVIEQILSSINAREL